MVEFKVVLRGSDGKDYVISYEMLRDRLGVDAVRDYLAGRIKTVFERLYAIEEHYVKHILQPQMEVNILALLKDTPELRTGEISQKSPNNRLDMCAWYHAFEKLEHEGKIVPTSHGQGHDRTWRVKEEA